MKRFTILFLLIILGCANIPIPTEKNASIEAFFCPNDDCEARLSSLIENANGSIHCSFYSLELDKIISQLSRKSQVIDVRLVLNGRNYKGSIKGGNIKLSKGTNHNKFCIIDNNVVITGSFNPTKKGVNDHNNLLIINSSLISKNYEDEFKEQWNGLKEKRTLNEEVALDDKKLVTNFCPEDNCKGNYLKTLRNAKSSIYFMAYSLTNEDVADALITREIDIKGILDYSGARSKYSQYKRLKGFGKNIKQYISNSTLHHKVFIIDNETVITGSANPTNNGFFNNDENIVIIYDPEVARKYLKEFDRLFP